jgi:hypothetical protein
MRWRGILLGALRQLEAVGADGVAEKDVPLVPPQR